MREIKLDAKAGVSKVYKAAFCTSRFALECQMTSCIWDRVSSDWKIRSTTWSASCICVFLKHYKNRFCESVFSFATICIWTPSFPKETGHNNVSTLQHLNTHSPSNQWSCLESLTHFDSVQLSDSEILLQRDIIVSCDFIKTTLFCMFVD